MKLFLACFMLMFSFAVGVLAESKTEKYDPVEVSQPCVDVGQECILILDPTSLVECKIFIPRKKAIEGKASLGGINYVSRNWMKMSGVEVRSCGVSDKSNYGYIGEFKIEHRIRGGDLV